MRILFFSSIFPRPYAPVRGVFCQRICEALAMQDAVTVVSPRPWPEVLKHWLKTEPGQTERVFSLNGLSATYPTYYYTPKLLRSAYGRFLWASVKRHVTERIMRWRPDAILSFWAHPDGEVAGRAANAAGIPSAVIVGGSDILLLGRNPARRKSLIGALRRVDAVLAVSKDLRNHLLELGVDESKIHVVYTGVDYKLFCPGDRAAARKRLNLPLEQKILLYVGNLIPLKGVRMLLDALHSLRNEVPEAHAYLIGGGPDRRHLERRASALEISDRVHFVGPIRQENLPDYYRAADMTILPSRSEGIPNVLRESLACGTPFVASRVGGIPEISTSPVNHLVTVGDAADWSSSIRRALKESSLARSAVERGPTWGDTALACRRILAMLSAGEEAKHQRVCHV